MRALPWGASNADPPRGGQCLGASVTTTQRWSIARILSLLLALTGSVAVAGGLFGLRDPATPTPTPSPDVAAAEVAAPAPPAPAAPPLFPEGLPVALQQTPAGLPNLSAQGCHACHWQAHEEWEHTPHAQAWTTAPFQEAIARAGGTTACKGCHLPLANQHDRLAAGFVGGDLSRPNLVQNKLWDATLMAEGVTCAACHVRDGVVVSTHAAPDAPHPVAVSAELQSAEFCATCHQLTWPEADRPFYDTYGEWKASAYAEAGITCQECHMPPTPGASAATKFAAHPSHAFEANLARGLSILLNLDAPEFQRGQPTEVRVTLQNTGAGHHIPTGSPFKAYRLSISIEDTTGKPLAPAGEMTLGRTIGPEAPWPTLADNRIPAGGEMGFQHTFDVSQKVAAQSALLVVRVLRTVPGVPSGAPEVLLERRIPVQVL